MKIELGTINRLKVVKEVDFGVYLDGGPEAGEILLPTRYVPENCQIGQELEVFLYLDQEERLIATTLTPKAMVGDFAYLKVAWINQYGAFLDWGLMKDLFVPFREQKKRMEQGKSYIVHVHIDEDSYRIVASAKIDRYLQTPTPETYKPGDQVQLLIVQKTDLGFKAIIDNQYMGLLYDNEIFQMLHTGNQLTGYIKQIREDGKIDLTLQTGNSAEKVSDFSSRLLHYIKEQGGHTGLNDKSDSQEIYETFGVSKKIFKKGIGDLYKRHLITLENGLTLTELGQKSKD